MSRIYFDSNIYSNLRRNTNNKYSELKNLISQYQDNFTFFFSLAHIRDKRNDLTEMKFEDFKFMEQLTQDNHLAYHPIEKRTSHYIATPLTVFNSDSHSDNNIRAALDIFAPSDDDDPIINSLNKIITKLSDVPIFDNIDLSAIPQEQRPIISKIFPNGQSNYSLRDLMTQQVKLYEDIVSNPQTYKDLRKLVDDGINNGKFTLNESSIDFNIAFKDSTFQKTFFEYVADSFNKKDEDTIPYYDFYMQAYHCLDLLGISKDKISQKNNFNNLTNDALHSYYAQYCDFFVTEDHKSIIKSKVLYNHFDCQTTILTVDELIDLLPTIGHSPDENIFIFFEKLSKDIRTGSRLDKSETDFGYQCVVETTNKYFNFFDVVFEVSENSDFHYILRKARTHILSAANYREEGKIIDYCLMLFGEDLLKRGAFNFEEEIKEKRNNVWEGRYWKIGTLILSLQRHHALKEFCLVISPLSAYGVENNFSNSA